MLLRQGSHGRIVPAGRRILNSQFAGCARALADFTFAAAGSREYDRLMKAVHKGYKGIGMEGAIAKWYASLTRKSMTDFQKLALRVAGELSPGGGVLEVAPGPGYFAVELAKLGSFSLTGLDISQTFVEIARANAAAAKVGRSVPARQWLANAIRQ